MDTNSIAPFQPFKLSEGPHASPALGMCAMEMVSWIAGEKWSDGPKCACPIIGEFVVYLNDDSSQWVRDEIQKRIPKIIGTRSEPHIRDRAMFIHDETLSAIGGESLEFHASVAATRLCDNGLFTKALEILDAAIEIGPHGETYTEEQVARAHELHEVVA